MGTEKKCVSRITRIIRIKVIRGAPGSGAGKRSHEGEEKAKLGDTILAAGTSSIRPRAPGLLRREAEKRHQPPILRGLRRRRAIPDNRSRGMQATRASDVWGELRDGACYFTVSVKMAWRLKSPTLPVMLRLYVPAGVPACGVDPPPPPSLMTRAPPPHVAQSSTAATTAAIALTDRRRGSNANDACRAASSKHSQGKARCQPGAKGLTVIGSQFSVESSQFSAVSFQ
jgi:hypothetical protein